MRSATLLAASAAIALALTACSSSSKPSSSGPATTAKAITTADFCAQVKGEADAFDLSGITRKSKDDLKRTYNDGADKLDALADAAPPEINDDMQTFVKLTRQLRAELADVDYDPTQLSLSAIPDLASPSTISAVSHISAYLRDTCHLVSSQTGG